MLSWITHFAVIIASSRPTVSRLEYDFHLRTAPDRLTFNRRLYFNGDDAHPQVLAQINDQAVMVVSDPEVARYILAHPDLYPNIPDPRNSQNLKALTSAFLPSLNGPQAKKYRRLLQPSINGVNSEAAITTAFENLCAFYLDPLAGKPVGCLGMFERVAMDVMGKSIFGMNLSEVWHGGTIQDDYRAAMSFDKNSIAEFKAHLRKAYEQHTPKGEAYLLTALKEAVDRQEITETEAIELMTFMFVAGQLTISRAMARLAYFLAKHPVSSFPHPRRIFKMN